MDLSSRLGRSRVCPPIPSPEFDIEPLINGWSAHQLFVIFGGAFMGATCIISMSLYMLHATHFSNPPEQRQILRIILFIPLFAVISFACLLLNDIALYLAPWKDVYEAFALASFYILICTYVSPSVVHQQSFFETFETRKGQHAGTKWHKYTRRAVFQYLPLAIIMAIVVDVTLKTRVYCVTSNSVHFAQIWTSVIRTISVVYAWLAAISFALKMRGVLHEQKILPKLVALKAVIIVESIQGLVFTILRAHLKPTAKISYVDLTTGIPSLLLCAELMLMSIYLHFSYTWKPYRITNDDTRKYYGGPLGVKAIRHAFNPADVIQSLVRAFSPSSVKVIDST